jgi:hypothetical protein
LCSQRH